MGLCLEKLRQCGHEGMLEKAMLGPRANGGHHKPHSLKEGTKNTDPRYVFNSDDAGTQC